MQRAQDPPESDNPPMGNSKPTTEGAAFHRSILPTTVAASLQVRRILERYRYHLPHLRCSSFTEESRRALFIGCFKLARFARFAYTFQWKTFAKTGNQSTAKVGALD